MGRIDYESETLVSVHGTQDPCVLLDRAHALGLNGGRENAIAFSQNQLGEVRVSKTVGTLNTNSIASGRNTPLAKIGMTVRRLTEIECERLQGFPDNFTAIPWRGKPADHCPGGPRYKAIGNSMAVPVMRWILNRLDFIDGEVRG